MLMNLIVSVHVPVSGVKETIGLYVIRKNPDFFTRKKENQKFLIFHFDSNIPTPIFHISDSIVSDPESIQVASSDGTSVGH